MSVQLNAGAAMGAPILATLLVGTVHIRIHLKIRRSSAFLACSVGP